MAHRCSRSGLRPSAPLHRFALRPLRGLSVRLGLPLLGAIALGCGSAPEVPHSSKETTAALVPLGSCGEVEAAIRGAAIKEMNRQIDENLEQFIENGGNCWYDDAYAGSGGSGGGANSPPSPSAEGEAKQVSGTNNQVAGVDEADFVKNDNEFIYTVTGGALHVVDAWPAADAHEIAKLPLEGTPTKLFVAGDRALVYASVPKSESPPPYGYGGYGSGECTYGYDCDFTGDGQATRISVFDLSNKAVPKLVRKIDLSGSFINARRIGNAVHTVVHDARQSFEGVSYNPTELQSSCGSKISPLVAVIAFESLRAKNTEIIRTASLGDWLPSMKQTTFESGQPQESGALLGDCQGFYESPLGDGQGFITLLSLSLDDQSSLASSSIISRPGAVYSSSDALYVAVRQSASDGYGWYSGMEDQESLSTIHKFNLLSGPVRAEYAASGLVKGSVLNQFAMDEWEGHLRVATTDGHVPDPNVTSAISILEESRGELVLTGIVDGIAPTEDIRSVRFSGDRGFIVTFKKTDPLFVFDLADPKAPRVLGELKIPGFSTYMHMMDKTHLLTIGYDADDQGSFAWFQGVLLQIFDVTDPTNPTLTHKEVIGTRGSSSEALTNHLAFNYFAPMDLLSFPITICEGGSGGSYGTEMTFSGLMVYTVTQQSGFTLKGKVAHPTDPSTGGYDSGGCSNWWTNASTKVKRSIIMDEFVYSVSEDLIKVNALGALSIDIKAIPIGS